MSAGHASTGHGIDAAAHAREVETWYAARIERLQQPDGWLSLVGLEWLQPGSNRVGSAPDNDIVLAGAPPHLGCIEWRADDSLEFVPAPDTEATVDGAPAARGPLRDDRTPAPSRVAFGTQSLVVIDRDGRKGLRVRDSQAATRTGFAGIERFPVDPDWRVVARWEPLDPPYALATGTVIGTLEHYPAPGRAVFEREGRTVAVYPVREAPGDRQLFLVFGDRTSGRETHGAARFLYADPPREGRIVLDFNKAYNPPCAFTAFATCPLAPPENRIDLAVTAGERKYRGGA